MDLLYSLPINFMRLQGDIYFYIYSSMVVNSNNQTGFSTVVKTTGEASMELWASFSLHLNSKDNQNN